MCQELEQLKVIDSIPEDFEQRDILVNRALDVRSACMRFLAANICHNATSFGITGRMHLTPKLTFQAKYSKRWPKGTAN
jgi:hypothetical protein